MFLVVSREVESRQGWLSETLKNQENIFSNGNEDECYIEDGLVENVDLKIPITDLELNKNNRQLSNNQSTER